MRGKDWGDAHETQEGSGEPAVEGMGIAGCDGAAFDTGGDLGNLPDA